MTPLIETLDRLGIDYYIGVAVASLTHSNNSFTRSI